MYSSPLTFGQTRLIAIAAASVGVAIASHFSLRASAEKETIVRGPAYSQLPRLSPTEIAALPYPPDALPGSRDVETPYGTIRLYEWGSHTGRKVLLVHGGTTPCIGLRALAQALVNRDCRVMLLDLFGKGYSDSPGDLPHDSRLYTTQILAALASSQLPWTGTDNSFSLVGYSLGGGIAMAFASYFPALLSSLILLAPSGLIRPSHFSLSNRLLYSENFLPTWLVHWIVRRRQSIMSPTQKSQVNERIPATALGAELPHYSSLPAERSTREIDVPAILSWQIQNHPGFVASFVSSLQHGPISGQHADWQRVGLSWAVRSGPAERSRHQNQILIVLGETDSIILADELKEDATIALGALNILYRTVAAGHDFPITMESPVDNFTEGTHSSMVPDGVTTTWIVLSGIFDPAQLKAGLKSCKANLESLLGKYWWT